MKHTSMKYEYLKEEAQPGPAQTGLGLSSSFYKAKEKLTRHAASLPLNQITGLAAPLSEGGAP